MNNIRIAGIWILLLIFFGILFWSILPSRSVENSFSTEPDQGLFQDQVCKIEGSYKNITIHIKHPAFLHYGTQAMFEVLVTNDAVSHTNNEGNCAHSIELRLDLDNISVKPNDRLFQPMIDNQVQHFVFELQPGKTKGKQSGNLWIYLTSTSPDDQSSGRIPLFVVPVEFEIRTLLGVPLLWVRLISLIAIILLFIAKVLIHRWG
ncbi:MAG: hypothetical protein FJZ98_03770 [Chloroflexi bacterium]|nr:hypothetical protein [Chloroflexota bacterium]